MDDHSPARKELEGMLRADGLVVDPYYIESALSLSATESVRLMFLHERYRQFCAEPARRARKWQEIRWEMIQDIHEEGGQPRKPFVYKTQKQAEQDRKELRDKIRASLKRD